MRPLASDDLRNMLFCRGLHSDACRSARCRSLASRRGAWLRRVACALCCLVFSLAGRPCTAQEAGGEGEAVAAQPARPGLFGRVARWVEANPGRAVEGLHEQGFYPGVTRFADGTGTAPSITYWRPGERSGIDFYASAARSFYGDGLFDVRLGRIPHQPSRRPSRHAELEPLAPFTIGRDGRGPWFLYFEVRDRNLRSGRFVASESQTLGYDLREDAYQFAGGVQLGRHTLVAARAGFLNATASLPSLEAGPLESRPLPDQDFAYFHTQLSLAVDGRDDAWDPRRGGFLEASWSRYADRTEGANGFDRVALDLRGYQPLGSKRHVLAVRGLGTFDRAEYGGGVPVFLQRTLGGSETLRGFQGFRFRGTSVVGLSGEYRFALSRPVELAAFYDMGRAWGGPEILGSSGWQSSYGFGVRFRSAHGVLLRLDAAQGSEGPRVHFKLGASF